MTRSELILEFIDGTLPNDAERELFDELARSPELRSELRDYYAIAEAVRADRAAYTPPAEVEQALLAGIGVATIQSENTSQPTTVPTESARREISSGFGALTGLAGIVIAFLLGGLLAGGGIWLSSRDSSTAESVQPIADAVHAVPPAPITPDRAAVPAASDHVPTVSESVGAAAGTRRVRTHDRTRLRASDRAVDPVVPTMPSKSGLSDAVALVMPADTTPATVAVAARIPVDASSVTTVALREPNALAVASAPDDDAVSAANPLEPTVPTMGRPSVAFVEARRQFAVQAQANDALPVTPSVGEDVAAGVYLRAGGPVSLGIEVGRERYAQTFTRSENGHLVQVDQRPAVLWCGMAMRYSTRDGVLLSNLHPFIQMTLGGSSDGPIGRGRLGMRFDVMDRLAISPSIEGSSMIYSHDGQSFISTRLGGSLGLEFDL